MISIGTEYSVIPAFAIRSGYASNTGGLANASNAGPFAGFAAGFGVKACGLTLDYSMTPFGPVGNAQRLSLGARW